MKIFSVLTAVIFSFSLFADVLPEGKKKVSYQVEIVNTGDFSDYVFLAYPVNTSGGKPMLEAVKVEGGKPFYLQCRFGVPVIYAISKNKFNPEDINTEGIQNEEEKDKKLKDYFETNTALIPSIKVNCTNFVDKDEKYSQILRKYKIAEIKSDTMIINTEKVQYLDKSGNVLEEKAPGEKGDVVDPVSSSINILFYAIPVLALVGIITVVLIRRSRK
jgi:hypothetical protein